MCICKLIKKIFGKKDNVVVASTDKSGVQAAYARAMHIAALAEEGSEVQKRLEALAEELKYLAPSSKEDVLKTDKKIENAVDDLRSMVVGKKDESKILYEIKEIDALVVYRKTLLATEI